MCAIKDISDLGVSDAPAQSDHMKTPHDTKWQQNNIHYSSHHDDDGDDDDDDDDDNDDVA